MKFVYNVYTLVIVLPKIIWPIVSEAIFDDMELSYLSRKLNPIECSKLLEAMYVKRRMTDDEFTQSVTEISLDDESILRRQLETAFFNRDDCRIKLDEWSRNLPQRSNQWARVTMETVLRTLGRPDLGKYVGRNGRVVRYRENEIPGKSLIKLGKRTTASGSIVSGSIQVTPSNEIFKGPPREAIIQYYSRAEEPEVPSQLIKTASGKTMGARGSGGPNEDNLATRWIAFIVLLGLVVLTILSTVVFALYKKKRPHILPKGESNKCSLNNCPGVDPFPRKHSKSDVEQGDRAAIDASSPCTKRRKRRFSTRELSLSPSSVCVREEIVQQCRRSKWRKSLEGEEAAATRRPSRGSTKRPKRRCDKKCTGLDEKVIKVDKSTLASEKRCEAPPKPRLELKKFHERIASILRRDDTACACCKCSVISSDAKNFGSKCLGTKKNICEDEKCPKTRLKSIAELCLSQDETSPEDEPDNLDSKKKAKRTKAIEKQSKKREQRQKQKEEKEKEKEQKKKKKKKKEESEKSSPENSARSKDKKESRESKTKKPEKAKKDMYNIEEACTRKTCDFRRSIGTEDLSNANDNF